MAEALAKLMHDKVGGSWHCIVGEAFGSFVAHEEHTYVRRAPPPAPDEPVAAVRTVLGGGGVCRLIAFAFGAVVFLLFKHG